MTDAKRTKTTGERTPYPGVYRIDPTTYRVRGKWHDAKTGRTRELDRLVKAASAEKAAVIRSQLRSSKSAAKAARVRSRLDDFATSWLASKNRSVKASTSRHYAETIDLYITDSLGKYFIDAITRADVEAWFGKQVGTDETKNGRLKVLRMLLAEATEGLNIPNPAARVMPIRIVHAEDDTKVLAIPDLVAVLEWLGEHTPYRDVALTLALTGMRYGEAAALKWSDVDHRAGSIRIARRYYRGVIDTPKNGRTRTVPMPPELSELLKARRRTQVREQAAGLEEGWVFASAVTGLPVRQVGLAQALKRAGRALKLARRPTPHSFRYSFNDLLRKATSGEVQRAIVGHSSAKMSEHYAHVTLDERRSAVDAALAIVRTTPARKSGDGGGDGKARRSTRRA